MSTCRFFLGWYMGLGTCVAPKAWRAQRKARAFTLTERVLGRGTGDAPGLGSRVQDRRHLWWEPGSPVASGGHREALRVWGVGRMGAEPIWFKCRNSNLFVAAKECGFRPQRGLGGVRGGESPKEAASIALPKDPVFRTSNKGGGLGFRR